MTRWRVTLHDRQLDLGPYASLRGRARRHADSRHRADDPGQACAAAEFQPRRRRRADASTISPRLKRREAGPRDRAASVLSWIDVPARPDGSPRGSVRCRRIQRDVHRVAEFQQRRGALGRARTASRWSAAATSTGCVSWARRFHWSMPSRDADAICAAIRAGKVQVEAAPRSWASAIGIMADLTIAEILPPGFWQETPDCR